MENDKLADVLAQHSKWLAHDGGGRANLSDADLSGAYLNRANLSRADLSRADLSDANLSDSDLSRADLSGAIGLLSAPDWIATFVQTADGVIVYRAVGNTVFSGPDHWTIAPGCILTEVANPDRCAACGCGINFATPKWIDAKYNGHPSVWECLIRWIDLAGVVVPYNTDGKARCERLTLLRRGRIVDSKFVAYEEQ